jgi:O-antigen/teichoic acid export membrane protein
LVIQRSVARLRAAATARQYLRLKPFDTSTPKGRADERYRRVALTAVASGCARAVSMGSMVVSIPLALSFLGAERYGVLVTITALTGMLVFADFGIGNGLMNAVAGAIGRSDSRSVQVSVSSAFLMLCVVAIVGGVVAAIATLVVPWRDVLNARGQVSEREAAAAVGVFFACLLANLPLGVVQKVQLGFQNGFQNSVWNAFGSLVALAGLWVAVIAGASLPWFVLALVGGPVLGNLANWLALFLYSRRDLRPRWSLANVRSGQNLMRVGFLFFVLQLAVAIAYESDLIVATRVVGPEAAAAYSVVFRLFMIVPTVVNMLLLPLWPAYSESIARGDVEWVRRTLKISIGVAVTLTGLSSLALLMIGPAIVLLWAGPEIDAPFMLFLGMALWAVVANSFNAIAMLMNGAAVIGFQVIIALTMALASLGLSILFANLFGIAGVVWGTLLAYVVCSAAPTIWYLPRVFRNLALRRNAAVKRGAWPSGGEAGAA